MHREAHHHSDARSVTHGKARAANSDPSTAALWLTQAADSILLTRPDVLNFARAAGRAWTPAAACTRLHQRTSVLIRHRRTASTFAPLVSAASDSADAGSWGVLSVVCCSWTLSRRCCMRSDMWQFRQAHHRGRMRFGRWCCYSRRSALWLYLVLQVWCDAHVGNSLGCSPRKARWPKRAIAQLVAKL